MTKKALLVGVSEYEQGLNPLPSAVRDVEAMQRVLQHPSVCGFAETFGFSMQKKIYLNVGGKLDGKFDLEAIKKFGKHVDWRERKWKVIGNKEWIDYSQVNFCLEAPEARLPICIFKITGFDLSSVRSTVFRRFKSLLLFSHVETCKV